MAESAVLSLEGLPFRTTGAAAARSLFGGHHGPLTEVASWTVGSADLLTFLRLQAAATGYPLFRH